MFFCPLLRRTPHVKSFKTCRCAHRRRRSLAAGSLAAEADQAETFSAEYYECERRWIAFERVRLSRADYHASEAEYKAEDAAFERYTQAEAALTARGVTTLSNAVALMRTEAWRHDSFVREQYDGIRQSLELAEKVTGHWHVPDDLIRLDAEMQAKEEAYFASRPIRWDPDDCIGSSRSWRQTPLSAEDEEHLAEIVTPENVKIGRS